MTSEEYSTCDFSDCLQRYYDIKDGGVIPNLNCYSKEIDNYTGKPKLMKGFAHTILFAPIDDPRPRVDFIDYIPDNTIIIIGLIPSLQLNVSPFVKINTALFGGLMSSRAHKLNCDGTIVLGKIRDIDEYKLLNYPIFGYGLSSASSNLLLKPIAIGVPLEILTADEQDNLIINENDFIIGDEHGIIRIPFNIGSVNSDLYNLKDNNEIIQKVDLIKKQDKLIQDDIIKKGIPLKEAIQKYRK